MRRFGREVGNLLFSTAVILVMTLAAVLCGIAKEEAPL